MVRELLLILPVLAAMAATAGALPASPILISTNNSALNITFNGWSASNSTYADSDLSICNNGTSAVKTYLAGTNYFIRGRCPVSNTMDIARMKYNFNGVWKKVDMYRLNWPCIGNNICRSMASNFLKKLQPGECINLTLRIDFPNKCAGTFISGGLLHVLNQMPGTVYDSTMPTFIF